MEIKEILEKLKENISIVSVEEEHLLLDYITNSQQENDRLTEQNNDLRKIYRHTYNWLFENGNDELARYFQAQINECRTFYVEPIIDYYKEWKDYKQRIEKAVEYIENAQERDGDEESCSLHVPTLKSILEGRSDE